MITLRFYLAYLDKSGGKTLTTRYFRYLDTLLISRVAMNDKNQSIQPYGQLKRQEDENRLLILEGIARGEREIKEGNLLSHQDAKAKLTKWLR